MAKEKIGFKIGLYATWFDKKPTAKLTLNGDTVVDTVEITGTKDKPQVLEFTAELDHDKEYELAIDRQGKDKYQTVVENGEIVKDQLLNIVSLEIDDIDLAGLVYEGWYYPEYPEPWATQQREAGNDLPEKFKNATILGHNGTWKFSFESPFYMWLLENLY